MNRFLLAAILAALLLPAQARAVNIGPACRPSPAPVFCAIGVQRDRTNHWRHLMGRSRLELGAAVYDQPHRRPYYLWLWHDRRTTARHEYRALWAWVYQPAVWCVHTHESVRWHYLGAHDGGFQYLVSTWLRAGGGRFAARAGYATPTEQIIVTKAYTDRYGWGEWSTAAGCGL